jgi:hypothetical protein
MGTAPSFSPCPGASHLIDAVATSLFPAAEALLLAGLPDSRFAASGIVLAAPSLVSSGSKKVHARMKRIRSGRD